MDSSASPPWEGDEMEDDDGNGEGKDDDVNVDDDDDGAAFAAADDEEGDDDEGDDDDNVGNDGWDLSFARSLSALATEYSFPPCLRASPVSPLPAPPPELELAIVWASSLLLALAIFLSGG